MSNRPYIPHHSVLSHEWNQRNALFQRNVLTGQSVVTMTSQVRSWKAMQTNHLSPRFLPMLAALEWDLVTNHGVSAEDLIIARDRRR